MPTIKYEDELIKILRDPQEASAYLNVALEEGDIDVFLLALRQVVKAQGGVSELARRTHKGRTSLYKTLSNTGNPYLKGTAEILAGLGLKLEVVSKNTAN